MPSRFWSIVKLFGGLVSLIDVWLVHMCKIKLVFEDEEAYKLGRTEYQSIPSQ